MCQWRKCNWHSYHEPGWSSCQLTLLSVWPSCISCHSYHVRSPLPQVDISCPWTRYSGWLRTTLRDPLTMNHKCWTKSCTAQCFSNWRAQGDQLTLPRVLLNQSSLFLRPWLQDPLVGISALNPLGLEQIRLLLIDLQEHQTWLTDSIFLRVFHTVNVRRVFSNAAIAFPTMSKSSKSPHQTPWRCIVAYRYDWLALQSQTL